ncbi:MAG: hypothetical protein IJD13_08155 [Oscillospiraceae bacterium]|nr:hypothetical protein [Oscillospiraceae bacterium]
MNNITVNFAKTLGPVKPMHSVNNGPAGGGVRGGNTSRDLLRAAGIPFSRNHDASFSNEHLVDVHRIFKNFDADENDPNSYRFESTDAYVKATIDAGMQVFYRLGASIEHGQKYGTFPPKDNAKWARICEHIIMHYNEGWADGFEYGIKYWEIWNEPDCRNRDGSNPCWQGTDEQFVELFVTALGYLKKRFPDLKIGGPAFCGPWDDRYNNLLLGAVKEAGIPLDFFSYHGYRKDPNNFGEDIVHARELLDKWGFTETETILNEWNYIRGWFADEWTYSLKMEKSLKGSSFIAGTMCVCQAGPLDHLMYYDARVCGMNGMFTAAFEPLKGYYPFPMFNELYKMGTSVEHTSDSDNLLAVAATDGKNGGMMLTYFDDNDDAPAREVKVDFTGFGAGKKRVQYYLLDETHDATLMREEIFTADEFSAYLTMPLFTTYGIKVTVE